MKLPRAYEAVMAADALPSPNAVALDLVAATRNPDATVEDVAGLIGMDPAICARVMRGVNTAANRTGGTVTSVEKAVTVLGMRTVAKMAVEVSILERNRTGLAEFDYAAFWAESLARAVAARIMASWTQQVPADDAFTYGLLSGIGRLALVSVYPQQYRAMLRTLGASDADELVEAERAVFEIDTETLSATMLRSWGMPSYHDAMHDVGSESVAAGRDRLLLTTCRTAGMVAQVLTGIHVTRDQIAATIQAMTVLGIGAEVVTHLFPDIVATLHEVGAQMDIRTGSVASLAEVYAHAIDAP